MTKLLLYNNRIRKFVVPCNLWTDADLLIKALTLYAARYSPKSKFLYNAIKKLKKHPEAVHDEKFIDRIKYVCSR